MIADKQRFDFRCHLQSIYQPYCHLHVYNSIKIMVGTFVSTIILSLQESLMAEAQMCRKAFCRECR